MRQRAIMNLTRTMTKSIMDITIMSTTTTISCQILNQRVISTRRVKLLVTQTAAMTVVT